MSSKKLVNTLPYREVDFIFITDHYDIHLEGICSYFDDICEFKTISTSSRWPNVEIYELNFVQRIKWIIRKWLFEVCVGKHWTYKDGKRMGVFYYKKPQFLWKYVFKFYYKILSKW